MQYHERKDETVYLLSGELSHWAALGPDGELTTVDLRVADVFRVTPGTMHYIQAVTDCDVREVSTPNLDDVVRLKDHQYGREGTSAA